MGTSTESQRSEFLGGLTVPFKGPLVGGWAPSWQHQRNPFKGSPLLRLPSILCHIYECIPNLAQTKFPSSSALWPTRVTALTFDCWHIPKNLETTLKHNMDLRKSNIAARGVNIFEEKKNATFQKMQILLPLLVLINLAQALVKFPPLKYSALDDRLLLSVPSSSPSSTQAFLSNRVFQNAQKSKDLRGWLAMYVVIHN